MKIIIEGVNDEIREVIPGGCGPENTVNMVIGNKNRYFIPVRLDPSGSIFGEGVNHLYLEEILMVKTKQQIKAEEAVKAAEESLKKAKEALEAVKK